MSANPSVDLSIVIPCYRCGDWLPELTQRLVTVIEQAGLAYEIILVNDASPDNTWSSICEVAQKCSRVIGIDLLYNAGQFKATLCGMDQAVGRLILTMDDDLQHQPEDIPKLLKTMAADAELGCVIGTFETKQHSALRNAGSWCVEHLQALMHSKPAGLRLTSFRLMRRDIAQAICSHRTAKPVIGPLLLRCCPKIGSVNVSHHRRFAGETGYSLSRLVSIAIDNITSASTLPLKIISTIGFLSAAGSACLGVWYLCRYLVGGITQPGFATIVLLISFFGGMTLLSVGMLGEYIIRVIHEVSAPPRYVVRRRVPVSIDGEGEANVVQGDGK